MEYLDIVDENGEPTGEIVDRETAHLNGIMHRTAHLWLARKKDNKVQILLQKRSEDKDSFPGCYDISSAGHITAGEDYKESAIRELKEELGVSANESDLIYCGYRRIVLDEYFYKKPFHDRQYSKIFLLWTDLTESEFEVLTQEVSEVCWMDFNECVEGVRNGLFKNCIALEELLIIKKSLNM